MIAEYFARVRYAGSRSPDLNTLRGIHALHVAAIPFENFSPFLGQAVPLDVAALEAKIIKRRRGGYCYEQNGLFKSILEEMGFGVRSIFARVHWMSPPQKCLSINDRACLSDRLGDGQLVQFGSSKI